MSQRQRHARIQSGHPLFSTFATTIRLLRWLLVGLVIFYLCSGITRVAPNEDAVIFRLGRLQQEVHPPGLLFALPEPFDRVVRIPTRTQHEIFMRAWAPDEESVVLNQACNASAPSPNSIATPMSSATMPSDMAINADFPIPPGPGLHPYHHGYTVTGDVNLIQSRLITRYKITQPLKWITAAEVTDGAKLIEACLYDSATKILAAMTIDEALGSGLEKFQTRVIEMTQKKLDRLELGVTLVAFEVNTLTPPEATVAAFAEVTSARVESKTLTENARTYRARVLPRAQSDAFRIRSEAEAEALQRRSKASAEAQSFLALATEHKAQPKLIEFRLKAEALEQVYSQTKTSTVMPDDHGSIDLYLPANP